MFAIVGLYAGVLRPYEAALRDARARRDAERQELAAERGLIAELPRTRARFAAAAPAAHRLRDRVFLAHDLLLAASDAVAYLNDAATASNLRLEQSDFTGREAAASGLIAMRLTLRGEGDLQGILTFVRLVRVGAAVTIDRLQLDVTEPGSGAGNATASAAASPRGSTPSLTSAAGVEMIAFQADVRLLADTTMATADAGSADHVAAAPAGHMAGGPAAGGSVATRVVESAAARRGP